MRFIGNFILEVTSRISAGSAENNFSGGEKSVIVTVKPMKLSEFALPVGFNCRRTKSKLFFLLNLLAPMLVAAVPLTNALPNIASTNQSDFDDLQKLWQTKVTIVSGAPQTVSKTPAAVSVVTQDDIKRSGAMNIPEALRLVPGLDVAQIDASQWAVSSRGFNDQFANKLLVLQDGRSIYTPLFGGVFWDVQGTMMEDIDHIEVVRGPGATLWGANAVDGVINILTKNSIDTQGWLVSGGGGNVEQGFGGVRYGGKIGDDAYYRVYGTYNAHDSTDLSTGGDADNSWQLGRIGFRADWNKSSDDLVTFQGDGYLGAIREVFAVYDPTTFPVLTAVVPDQMDVGGLNALARWTHTISDTANFKLQTYYDFTTRDSSRVFSERQHTFDLSFQNEFAIGDRNKAIWGLGYRLTSDQEESNPGIMFDPRYRRLNLFSGFAQDEIAIIKDYLSLTLGTKIEHNDFTGFEVEPGARLLWTPTEKQTFWASISRAVRTPTRADEDVTANVSPATGFTVTTEDNKGYQSENLLAYEIGYRTVPWKNLSLDLAAFYNDYSRLGGLDVVSFNPFPPTQTLQQVNNMAGDTYGFEGSATWHVTSRWRLIPSYTLLKMELHATSAAVAPGDVAGVTGQSPQQQFSIRSSLDLPRGVTIDTALRYVDRLQFPMQGTSIPAYFELDARLAWQINKHWEAAIVGQNLLHPNHKEFVPTEIQIQQTEIPRSIYAKISYTF